MGENRLGQPTDDAAKRSSNGENPFQVSLIDVAPLDRTADKTPQGKNGQQPWRRQWGEVAPGAQDLPPINPQMDKNPNVNGGNGADPWRAQPGVAPVVPGAGGDRPPEDKPNPGGNPPGGGVDDWKDFVEKNKPKVGPGFQNPNDVPGGAPGAGTPMTPEQIAILEASKRPKSSITGLIYTGGITGAVVNGGVYALDARLMKIPEGERTGLMKLWERVSPTQAALKTHTDAYTAATGRFGIAHSAEQLAQSNLSGLAQVPVETLAAAEAKLLTLKSVQGEAALLTSQQRFLQNIAAARPDELAAAVGAKGAPNVLFESGTAAAAEVEAYARFVAGGKVGAAPSVAGALGHVETQLRGVAPRLMEWHTADATVEFLRKGHAGKLENVRAVIGTAEEVSLGQKLFVTGSPEATKLVEYAERTQALATATADLSAAKAALGTKESALTLAKERGAADVHGSFGGTSLRGFAKGLGISAATLAAGYGTDYMLGQQFGYKPSYDGTTRFLLDGVAIPTILLSDFQPRTKLWMAGLAFAGARAADYFQGSGASADMSMLLRPNTIDMVGITGSMLLPISGKYKALGIAGTIALGRGWNYLARKTGLDGYNNSAEVLDGDLTNLRTIDSTTQSVSSFERTVEKAKELGISNPAVLEARVLESMNRTNQHPVEQDRNTAALAYGLGLARLEKGSRLDVTDYTPTAYFLEGKSYDFGGTAAEQLNSALTSLERARKYADGHRGESVNGRAIDDAYVNQLNELKGKVTSDLNVIYGEQNVGEVYDTVKGLCRTKVQTILTFIVSGNQKLQSLGENLSPADVRYAAKLARDLCVANMAYAEHCASLNNGEDAKGFFSAAEDHLRNAEALEKSSKNLAKLKEQADRVRVKIPGAVSNQWGNSRNNPFEIKPNK